MLPRLRNSYSSLIKGGKKVMDAVVQKALREVQVKTKNSVPWKADEVWKQDCHTWTGTEWTPKATSSGEDSKLSSLALYSWNVDFMLPYADSRMGKAIEHLQSLIPRDSSPSTANVVFFQECLDSDIKLMASHPWIRDTFAMSDLDTSNWQSGHYGTISLIDRRLPIASIFRVHYSATRMERDGLFVDVKLQDKAIRLCNTHLESLALEPPNRIPQMKLCAEYMHSSEVDGAIVAGDFNAIQDFDRTLHSENGLKDAFLEQGGNEDDPKGHTWGHQAATALRMQFGTSRMDKVYFSGGVQLSSFEKFGADICVDDAQEKKDIVGLGFDEPWITDHLGVKAVFRV